ncbi:MAG: hypothetical protein EP335_05805 [Alphaproteobacteria bacterium]|nr:MAG: hypothetical protein EP335_05805 [Alphaproteobacteria bacterium]
MIVGSNFENKKLLRRPRPEEGESLMGYLVRVAEENGYARPGWLFDMSVSPASLPMRQSDPAALAAVLGIEVDTLADTCYWPLVGRGRHKTRSFLGVELPDAAVKLKRPKVCPACLGQKPFRRAIWDLSVVACCPTHGNRLLDRCPGCARDLAWSSARVASCGYCGLDLSTVVAAEADAKAVALTTYVLCQLGQGNGHRPAGFSVLDDLTPNDLCRLIIFLGLYSVQDASGYGARACAHLSVRAAYDMIAQAARVLDEWPTNFFALLELIRTRAPAGAGTTGLAHDLGSFYEALGKDFRGRAFDFLWAALQDYANTRWDGGLVSRRNSRLKLAPVESRKYMDRQEAAKVLRCAPTMIDRMIEEGHLKGHVLATGARKLSLVERRSVIRRLDEEANTITPYRAGILLGLSEVPFRAIVERGLLNPLPDVPINRSRTMLLDRMEVEAFIKRVVGDAPQYVGGEEDLVGFPIAVRMLTTVGLGIADLLEMVVRDQINVKACDTREVGVRQCCFAFADMEKILERNAMAPEDVLSLPEAAAELCLKQEVLYGLVKRGLLQTRETKIGVRFMRTIARDEVERFRTCYVSAAECAKARGKSPKALVENLRNEGLQPVTGPNVDGGRQYFFERAGVDGAVAE